MIFSFRSSPVKSRTKPINRAVTEPAPEAYHPAKSTPTPPAEPKPKPPAPKEPASPEKSPVRKLKPKKLAVEEKVQSYNITIETGLSDGQGTDANVFITLLGSKAKSKRTMLREDPDNFTVSCRVKVSGVGMSLPAKA